MPPKYVFCEKIGGLPNSYVKNRKDLQKIAFRKPQSFTFLERPFLRLA